MARAKDLVIEVRRDGYSGRLYSQVRDRNVPVPPPGGRIACVVIDRQNGRHLDAETVIHRAQYLSELLGKPYDEDLEWPCVAALHYKDCRCPRCVKQSK